MPSQPESVWVADLIISERTRVKVDALHSIDAEAVRQAVVCVRGLRGTWDEDDERGERMIVSVVVGRVPTEVVLYPVDHPMGDVWSLGSAYPGN
jgi:hypothetical protein